MKRTIKRRKDVITPVFDDLKASAARKKLDLHPSFKVELENYARHKIVKDLPEEELRIVLKTIGEIAIDKKINKKAIGMATRTEKVSGMTIFVGGGNVREAIGHLCDDPHSDCSRAAVRVLQRADHLSAAKHIQDKIEKLYKK